MRAAFFLCGGFWGVVVLRALPGSALFPFQSVKNSRFFGVFSSSGFPFAFHACGFPSFDRFKSFLFICF
jgi:hypothetical protein